MNEQEDVREALRAARKARGHSQPQAAAAMKVGAASVSVDAVRDWEHGRRRPRGLYAQVVERYIRSAPK